MNILFLDLDGTIRETKTGKEFINEPEDQQPIKGALKACNTYHSRGWTIVGITNQGGVKAGYKTLESAFKEQSITLNLFPMIDSILFCPDDGFKCYQVYRTGDNTAMVDVSSINKDLIGSYRKPDPGMIKLAKQIYQISYLFIGDRPEDQQAALGAKVQFQWAKDWLIDF